MRRMDLMDGLAALLGSVFCTTPFLAPPAHTHTHTIPPLTLTTRLSPSSTLSLSPTRLCTLRGTATCSTSTATR